MLKYIFTLLIAFSIFMNAATITANPNQYNAGEQISVTLTDMLNNEDWIGVYPQGVGNEWENIVSWAWTNGNDAVTLDGVPAGNYEIRAFFNNSFNVEATDTITVNGEAATIEADKNVYDAGENITITLANMSHNQDWIGIYPQGAGNEWENVVSWAWTEGNNVLTLDGVPAGNYEVRAFFNNSFNVEATDTFIVNDEVLNTTIETNKVTYDAGEEITITLTDMLNNNDWIGIYPQGAGNEWENVVSWAWTEGNNIVTLNGVPAGNYEIRAFFNNSFTVEATDTFIVNEVFMEPTIYEDAEDGDTDGWQSHGVRGSVENRAGGGFENSDRSIYAHVYWSGYTLQSDYSFSRDNMWNNAGQKYLKFDHHTPNWTACFHYGVMVETTQGRRYISWDAWFSHKGWDAQKLVYDNGAVELVFPTPGDVRREPWTAHSYDIEAHIQQLEPDNHLLSIEYFYMGGGDYYDNIRLESQE